MPKFTQEDAIKLRRAMVSGRRRVSSPGIGDVEFQRLQDMQALYGLIMEDLAGQQGQRGIRTVRISHRKGF